MSDMCSNPQEGYIFLLFPSIIKSFSHHNRRAEGPHRRGQGSSEDSELLSQFDIVPLSLSLPVSLSVSLPPQAICTEAGLMALRERRMKVTNEDFKKSKENVLYKKQEGTPEGLYL